MSQKPYRQYESSPVWTVVEEAIRDLEDNQDIEVTTSHHYVIGYLCEQIIRLYDEDGTQSTSPAR
ncbi:MAG: hypothetical protein P8099_19300 [Gemmatimonadota bacterium]|jgi:hypothetical protein